MSNSHVVVEEGERGVPWLERLKSRKRALLIGAALLATAGAATLVAVLADDGELHGRNDDDQPLLVPPGNSESPTVAENGDPAVLATASPSAAPRGVGPVAAAGKGPAARPGHAAFSHPAGSQGSGAGSAHPDGGAAVGRQGSPDGGARAGPRVASASKDEDNGTSPDEAPGSFVRVARFAPTGGTSLQGRVVDADSGGPVAGAVVEAVLGERFMEGRTDASGAFHLAGMLPATRVRIWIGGKRDPFVAERIDVGIPGEGQVAEAGVIRLLPGDELSSRLDGWVGLFVARRGGRVLASAVSPWLPADRAGIEVGDVLVSIDGRDVAGFGPRAAAFLLRGPPKSSVALAIETRDGTRRKLSLERVLR